MEMLGNILWRVLADANRARKDRSARESAPASFKPGESREENTTGTPFMLKTYPIVRFTPRPSIVRAVEVDSCNHYRQRSVTGECDELAVTLARLELSPGTDGEGIVPGEAHARWVAALSAGIGGDDASSVNLK